MSVTHMEDFEQEELAKKRHFEAMERRGQMNLWEAAYLAEKEKNMEQANSEQPMQNSEQNSLNSEQKAESGAVERVENASTLEKAITKLEAEMQESKDAYVQTVGQFMLAFLKQRPEFAPQIMQDDKSITKSLEAMRKEAEKRKNGNCAVLTSDEGFAIVLAYYGIQATTAPPAMDAEQMAKKVADQLPPQVQVQPPVSASSQERVEPVQPAQSAKKSKALDITLDELL